MASGLLASSGAMAQDAVASYPSKPINFVVPYAAGGPLDTIARLLGEKVQTELKQTVIVENKAGAGGNIGANVVARAQPDGYSLVMGAVAIQAINPWLYKNIPFDPIKDFSPVILVSSVPNVLIVNKDFAGQNNINTLQDLLDYAKANTGKLNYASGGSGSAGHLAGELMKARTGIDAVHVPYGGANPAKLSLLSNQTQFMFDNLASSLPLINEGQVKALAVTTKTATPFLPDTPTMEAAGIEDFDIGTWFGIFTTGGTPDGIINKLNAAYSNAMNDPAVLKQLQTMGSNTKPGTAQEFADFVKSEHTKYKEIVEISGATIN
ncbi:MAG: tripartite tricarboxylate transporter substrate binding protein [Alcaligenaceae bacterium]|nr:tripartite tricarboxylate transporter substrate binding protein [Alcaligenaceae bacterium]